MKNADRARALLEIKSENRNLIFRQSSRYSSPPIQCLPCSQIGIFHDFPAKWPCPSSHPIFLQYLAWIAWCQQHSSLFLGSLWSRMNSWNPRMTSQSIETTTLIWQMPRTKLTIIHVTDSEKHPLMISVLQLDLSAMAAEKGDTRFLWDTTEGSPTAYNNGSSSFPPLSIGD